LRLSFGRLAISLEGNAAALAVDDFATLGVSCGAFARRSVVTARAVKFAPELFCRTVFFVNPPGVRFHGAVRLLLRARGPLLFAFIPLRRDRR